MGVPFIRVRTELQVLTSLRGWLERRRDLLPVLERTIESARELGDTEYAGVAARLYVATLAGVGEPVKARAAAIERLRALESAPHMSAFFHVHRQLLRLLRETGAEVLDWTAELRFAEEHRESTDPYMASEWPFTLVCLGQHDRAAAWIARMSPTSIARLGVLALEVRTLQGIAAGARAERLRGLARHRELRVLRRARQWVRARASHAPDAVHQAQWLDAEHARATRDTATALRLYAQASRAARQHGYRHHAALAHERRAELLQMLGRTTESRAALRQAIELYQEWGATAKVAQLEARMRSGAR